MQGLWLKDAVLEPQKGSQYTIFPEHLIKQPRKRFASDSSSSSPGMAQVAASVCAETGREGEGERRSEGARQVAASACAEREREGGRCTARAVCMAAVSMCLD